MRQFFLGLLIVMILFGKIQAQFSPDSAIVISEQLDSADYLYPQITAADSGYFVTWYDEAQNFKMYMQYINPKGEPQWQSPVIVTDYEQDSWISDYALINDGSNAYVFFNDARNGLTDKDVFGYKINSQGEFLWGDAGIELIVSSDYDSEYSPNVTLMSNGDVVIAWNKMGVDGYTVKMQWLTPSGEKIWDDGFSLAESDIRIYNPNVLPATDSSVLLVYTYQDGQYGDKQIYAQQIDTSGQNLWDSALLVTNNSGIGSGRRLKLYPDSDTGIYITWYGDPDGNTLNDVFTQYINPSGNMRFENGGLNLSVNNTMNQTLSSCVGSDEEGNAMFVWHESDFSKENNLTKIQKVGSDGTLMYGNDALTISNELTGIGNGSYQYGKVFLPSMLNDFQGAMAIYDLQQDSMKIIQVGPDDETYTNLANGQFVFASVNDTTTFSQVELHNVYRDGRVGVEPIIDDAALSSLAGLKGFLPDSVFYYTEQNQQTQWNDFAQKMNIYQEIEYLDTPAVELGNYRVKVTAHDSSIQFYQFSVVDEPLASIESMSSDYDLWTHVDYENNDAYAELQLVKDPQKLINFELSPGARIFLNGSWDADYRAINDTASDFFNIYKIDYDSAFVDFDIIDYHGATVDWRLVMTVGGGIKNNSFDGIVYPNPVTHILNLESPMLIKSVNLFTIDGRPLKQMKVNGNHVRISVDKLSPGTYILLINQKGQFKSHVFTKTR